MFPSAENISHITSHGTPRNEQESPQNLQVVKQNKKEITANMLITELIFCIALALTTYGAFHNTPSKISKHPQPVRFFSRQSSVSDSYKGQLRNALTSINKEDISFVMYYAPWDAESQYVRGEFEKAANILNNRVHFAAINCWNPGSECRLQHHKIPSWPILMVYTVTSKSILYKGARDAYSMVKFLELIVKPMERISSTDDLINLLSVCDVVAVGYTPLTETSKYYNVWYNVALKAKEFDVIGEICFAVVTSEELSSDIGVYNLPSARLMLWNDTKEYNLEDDIRKWNDSLLINWIFQNFRQPVARILPMWQKNFSFEKYADGNPMLMLFAPMNPLYELLPSYALLQEIAMEYYNCNNSANTDLWITELMKVRQVQRLIHQQKDVIKYCKGLKFKAPIKKPSPYHKKEVIAQNNKYPWTNTSEKLQKTGLLDSLFKNGLSLSSLIGMSNEEAAMSLDMIEQCDAAEFPAVKSFYENCQHCDRLEDILGKKDVESEQFMSETTMLPLEEDTLSAENLAEEDIKHFCNITKFAATHSLPSRPLNIPNSNITSIKGLACKKNFTMHMIAVDSVRNHHFAESLGIDIMNRKDMTAIVILDSKHESQYILKEEYSAKSVRDFIRNFTDNFLTRSLRSNVFDATHTHYFGSASDGSADEEYDVMLEDLTTASFRKLVRTQGVLSIVALCNGICPASVTRALASARLLLARCGVEAVAGRVDVRRHDLSWQYAPHLLPAVIVLPQRDRESESRNYPISERITSSGVLALALRSMRAPHYLRARLALCGNTRNQIEKKICLKDVREHITTLIGRKLRYWRQTESKELKDALLKRLQQLHIVSLDLSLVHTTDLSDLSVRHKSLLISLSALSNDLEIEFANTKSKNSS